MVPPSKIGLEISFLVDKKEEMSSRMFEEHSEKS
jgi:hypothetical protein